MSAPARRLELGRVGESVRRVDAIPKVTGEFAYASDLFAAGMLYGYTVRSPHAAARVKRIDVTEARGMAGVHAVLTHKDVPGEKRYGLEFPDQAVPDGKGGIDVYVATQWLHVDRDQVAPCLGLEPEQVRIHLAGVGGAFGGREDLSMQIHGAMLALHTNRPVKIVYSREESFVGHIHRHPAKIWAEHRATREGKLVCVRVRILLDGGAYASSSTAVTSNAASFACGPYKVENALIESTCVYTNNPPCGAMRGFGAVQSCFAHEAQMDKLAAKLGIDPVELRLLNALGPGDRMPMGQRVTGSLPVAEVIRRAAALPVPEAEELPRDPIRLPGGAGNTTHGQGVRRVVWIGAAQDVGKALNPQAVYGQIEGGTAQGLGLALMEEIQTRDGLITNASFTDYLIPTTLDMPPVDSVLIEDPEPDAPYGLKGVGEPPTVVSTAAIVSALRDATGRELNRVPVRPDDICL